MLTPLGLELLDLEIGCSLLQCCNSSQPSNLKIKRFDRVKDVTAVHKLVIDNSHIVDIARYLRCDARNLYTHGVVLPSQKDDQDREERDHKRGKTLTERDEEGSGGTLSHQRDRSGRSLGLLRLEVGLVARSRFRHRGPIPIVAPMIPRFGELNIVRWHMILINSCVHDFLPRTTASTGRGSRCRD